MLASKSLTAISPLKPLASARYAQSNFILSSRFIAATLSAPGAREALWNQSVSKFQPPPSRTVEERYRLQRLPSPLIMENTSL